MNYNMPYKTEGFENGGSILSILRKNGSDYIERRKENIRVNEKLVNELFEKIDLADEYIKMQANRMSPSKRVKLYGYCRNNLIQHLE